MGTIAMKVACMSDIHGMWDQVDYPKADILVIAGDILKNYSFDRGTDAWLQLTELQKLNNHLYWLKEDEVYKEVFVVAGNHDFVFQHQNEKAREALKDVIYLQDESVNFGGPDGKIYKIYGSPWQPWFWDWAFNFPNHNENFFRARAHARATWELIPDDTNILITHGPPLKILDRCYDGREVGCQYLEERIDNLEHLKLHVFGHIHYSYGTKVVNTLTNPVKFVNAATCGEDYKPDNPIQVVDIEV